MRILLLMLFSLPVFAQTVEEQIEQKAQEIAILCAQANPNVVGCYVVTQPVVCPDPLAGTRVQLQEASQTINQVLTANPAP